jgi:hypothetical protein
MAVAEMVRADCLVFVPKDGGQVEIVGGKEQLLYKTPEEAVAKIAQLLGDTGAQTALRAYLATRKELFSTELFVRQIQDIVRQFV